MKALHIALATGVVLLAAVGAAAQPAQVRLNQVGFYPGAPKMAIVTGQVTAGDFYVLSAAGADTVFAGTLGNEQRSAYSSTFTRKADFSALRKKGRYVLAVPGLERSCVFDIMDDAGKPTAIASLKSYYYQRASMALEERYAGKWRRASGHPDDVVYIHASAADGQRKEGEAIASPGGWYDAGDYNKYIVNSGITMGTLLSAYEDFPAHFKRVRTNIPESGDAVPDILNEVIYNLRWMLTMQDPRDGGVYHKCTNAAFDKMIMPAQATARRYVVQKSTAATLDFAAVTAQAARVLHAFEKQLPGLADSCLRASKKAWDWAEQHPAVEYNQPLMNGKFEPAVSTGAYGDKHFADEWLWAAAELHATTGQQKYRVVVEKHMSDQVGLPSWANVGMLGFYTLLRKGGTFSAPLEQRIVDMANSYIEKSAANAFGTVMGQSARDFNWGGNANAANQGILLVRAYLVSGDKKYIDHALTNFDYLLGRNATGYSFVTGAGCHPPMFPHHRLSIADGIAEPIPGLLVGGPNAAMQDNCDYPFTETETAYADVACSYASNEIAINWNAPLVYLTNALEALKEKVGYAGGAE